MVEQEIGELEARLRRFDQSEDAESAVPEEHATRETVSHSLDVVRMQIGLCGGVFRRLCAQAIEAEVGGMIGLTLRFAPSGRATTVQSRILPVDASSQFDTAWLQSQPLRNLTQTVSTIADAPVLVKMACSVVSRFQSMQREIEEVRSMGGVDLFPRVDGGRSLLDIVVSCSTTSQRLQVTLHVPAAYPAGALDVVQVVILCGPVSSQKAGEVAASAPCGRRRLSRVVEALTALVAHSP